jgi:hypothetical protein
VAFTIKEKKTNDKNKVMDLNPGLPDFSRYNQPKREKFSKRRHNMFTKLPNNIPNHHKIYQITRQYPKSPENTSNLQKISQITRKYIKSPENVSNHQKISQITRKCIKSPENVSNHRKILQITTKEYHRSTRRGPCSGS